MANRNIHLFLIPMPLQHFCAFGLLSFSYESSCMPFFLNFNSSSSIPSVLLCERRIHVLAHGWRGTFSDLLLISSAFVLMYNAFIGVFDSYLPFAVHFLAWDHLYLIYCLPCFFPWALCCHSLGNFKCDMDGTSKQYSRPFDSSLFHRG